MGKRFDHEREQYDHPYRNYEDLELQRLLHRPRLFLEDPAKLAEVFRNQEEELAQCFQKRDGNSMKWGWKYPGTVFWLLHTDLAQHLRSPYFITVFRDPLAIVQRELSEGTVSDRRLREDGARGFDYVLKQVSALVEFVKRCDSPHLLVSFERMISCARKGETDFVDDLIAFLNLAEEVSPAQREKALASIQSAPESPPGDAADKT